MTPDSEPVAAEEPLEAKRVVTIRKLHLSQEGVDDDEVARMTPEQRMELIWPLTVDAWAMMGEDIAEFRLPRHVVRVIRRGR